MTIDSLETITGAAGSLTKVSRSAGASAFSLLDRLPKPGTCRVVPEATGDLQRRVVAALVDAGHHVSVVNPRQVRDYAKALGILAKTDAADAKAIARSGQDVKPRNVAKAPEKQAEPDQLATRRRQLVNARAAESDRLRDDMPKRDRQRTQRKVESMNKYIDKLNEAVLEPARSDDDWKRRFDLLEGGPGVGGATAAALVAEPPEPGRLNRQRISALVGVAPHANGGGGRRLPRSTLYMATLGAMRFNSPINRFAQRLWENGKQGKVVIVARMRKLLVDLNAMIKDRSPWRETTRRPTTPA